MDRVFTSCRVEERSIIPFVKREIHHEVAAAKFGKREGGEIDIIVSEITSNLVKHATRGELLYRVRTNLYQDTFEIICIDKGPGMDDIAHMKKDGISTTNTLGQGLGAIERLSGLSQIYSIGGWGTIVYARVNGEKKIDDPILRGGLDISALCVCKPHETVSGDGYWIKKTSAGVQIFFGDGLGHGPAAKEATDRAGDFFLKCPDKDPVSILRQMHEAVRRTRGLVAFVADWDKKSEQWSFCGVGNIQARLFSGMSYKNYMSYNGTLGLNIPSSMKSSIVTSEKNQYLIISSDGLRSRWELTRYPSILKYDGIILASALYKDFTRGNDDASILIAKVL